MTAKDKIQGFDGLLEFVRKSRGPDFADYKAPSVMRRVRKRMTALGVTQFGAYRDYLQANPEEFARLFDALLINVTSFFRDEPAWEALAREVLPRIIEASGVATPIRVWTPGCASGEETFTLAMIMAECLGESAFRERVKI